MEQLDEYCRSDELSLTVLREKISQLSTTGLISKDAYNQHPFLHSICENRNVTLEMVECILHSFPGVAAVKTDGDMSYALHCACYNNDCPNEVIQFLVKQYPLALEHLSNEWIDHDEYKVAGLPLHYYLRWNEDTDVDTVKMMVEAYPQSLMFASEEGEGAPCYPLHALLSNDTFDLDTVSYLSEIITCLLELEPSSLRVVDGYNRTPLHLASRNKRMTFEVFSLLFNAWPEAIRIRDQEGSLPIHFVCGLSTIFDFCDDDDNDYDCELIEILNMMLNRDPTLLRERDNFGYLPLHCAIDVKSTDFCKVLIDSYPDAVRIRSNDGSLPVHVACREGYRYDTVKTIRYLLELYPESINARRNGRLLIHEAARGGNPRVIELLLERDLDVASIKTEDGNRHLPLHLACVECPLVLEAIKVIFDAYPKAISIRDIDGKLPSQLVDKRNKSVKTFFSTQLDYARTANDMAFMMTLDENGCLPLHQALKDNSCLGTIKLLLKGNPAAIQTVDNKLAFPLHLACQFSSVKVVKFLVEQSTEHIRDHLDANKNSILHYACRGGNFGVIKYLLNSHASLVALSTVNAQNMLPLYLLCESAKSRKKRESPDYIEAIWLLLVSNPEVVVNQA